MTPSREPETAGQRGKPAVAYYRHAAWDHYENSVPAQRDQVRKWANKNGANITREFTDHGES